MSFARDILGAAMIPMFLSAAAVPAFAGDILKVEYTFSGGADGGQPSPLVGYHTPGQPLTWALYGEAANGGVIGGEGCEAGCGLVFKLSPPPPGTNGPWTKTTLYAFNGIDGHSPQGGLVFDRSGAAYGVTANGGISGAGTVFKLTPPSPGHPAWTATVLHTFSDAFTGVYPSSVILDASGALYGVASTSTDGVVFQLLPPSSPSTSWHYSVLHLFTSSKLEGGPVSGRLVMGAAGALYGTTDGGGTNRSGTIFKLTPPTSQGGTWTHTILFSEPSLSDPRLSTQPRALLRDPSGTLFGVERVSGSSLNGAVFRLDPPAAGGTAWTRTVLHEFDGHTDGGLPNGLTAQDGALFGATYYGGYGTQPGQPGDGGTVFKLTPPAAGKTTWTETLLHSFSDAEGYGQNGDVVFDGSGNLYSSTQSGGALNEGIVYKIFRPSGGF